MATDSTSVRVLISRNGPYLVTGKATLKKLIISFDAKGESERWDEVGNYPAKEEYALCRCGQSKTRPFCDGTHAAIIPRTGMNPGLRTFQHE